MTLRMAASAAAPTNPRWPRPAHSVRLRCRGPLASSQGEALIAQGVAAEENPPGITGIGRVCRIHGR